MPVFILAVAAFALNGHASASADYDAMRANWVNMLTGTANGGLPINYNDTDIKTRMGNIRGTCSSFWSSMEENPTSYLWSDLTSTSVSTTSTAYDRLWRMSLGWATSGQEFYQNAALQADIATGLHWLNQNRYNTTTAMTGNWWTWEIGIPLTLSNILAIHADYMRANRMSQLQEQIKTINRFCPSPTNSPASYISEYTSSRSFIYDGANGTWRAQVRAAVAVVTKQNVAEFPNHTFYAGPTNNTNNPAGPDTYTADIANDIANIRTVMNGLFAHATTDEGLFPDGTFIAHSAHPYNGGYGVGWMSMSANLLALLNGPGSIWTMTPTDGSNFPIFCDSIFKMLEPIIFKGDLLDMFRGREVSRSSSQDHGPTRSTIGGLARLIEVPHVPQSNVQAYKNMIRRWCTAGNPGIALDAVSGIYWGGAPGTIMRIKDCVQNAQITSEPEGNFRYVRGDRVSHRSNNFMFGIAMFSTRVNNYEFGNGENKKGYYLGTGATYLHNDDLSHYNNAHWPTIDALRIPGNTVQNRPRSDGSAPNVKSNKNTVGMTGNGRFGVACMDLGDPISKTQYSALSAKKTWFMFDDEIVCIGTGIGNGSDTSVVETIVENRMIPATATAVTSANTTINTTTTSLPATQWAYLNSDGATNRSIGYYFPDSPGNLKAKHNEARTGSWRDLNDTGSATALNANFFTLWFDHGTAPSGAASMYKYVLLPNKTQSQVSAYAANPHVAILRADASGVCVREQVSNVTGFISWVDASTTGGFITVNKKACVLVDESESEYTSVALSDPTQANTGTINVTLAGKHGLGGVVSSDPGITVTSLNPITFTVNVNGSLGRTYNVRFHSPTQTYAVTYQANGATGGTAPAPQTKIHDVALTLATNSGGLVRTGYTFSGWNTAANGTGTTYATGASYTTNAPLTLYAKWTNLAPTVATPANASPNPVTGTTTTLNVLGADDGGEAALTYTWAATGSPPAPVSFSVNGTNAAKTTVATFTQPGTYTLQCTITDAPGLTAASPVTVTVVAPNQAPVAHAQSVSTQQGAAKPITLTGSDPDGNPLTYSIVTQPSNGSLSGTAPAVTYSPASGYSGADSFTFKVNDGLVDSPPATVSITVSPAGGITPDITTRDDGYTVARFASGSGTWTIPAGVSSVELLVVGGGGSGAAGGTWNADGGGAGGLVYYTDYPVTAGSGFTVSVGAGGAARQSYGNGNAGSPSAFGPLVAQGGEGGLQARGGNSGGLNINGTITAGGLGATHAGSNGGGGVGQNGTGNHGACPGGNGLSYAITGTATYYAGGGGGGYSGANNVGGLGGGGKGATSGEAGFGHDGVNGLGGGGGASRDHSVSGAGGGGVVIVAYQVQNAAPVADPQSVGTTQNTAKAITLTGTDPDGDPLTYLIVNPPSNGTLAGIPPAVTYTPAPGYLGSDAFTYKVNDGTVDSLPATVSIQVVPQGGLDHSFANMLNTNFTVPNGDNLIIGSGSSNYLRISYGESTTTAATVDASLASNVTINVGDVRVGGRSDPTSTGTSAIDGKLYLGANNSIAATTLVEIGAGGHITSGLFTTASNSTTTIQTPLMSIGTLMRGSGSITTGSGSSLSLQGTGSGRTALIVGEERHASGTINWGSSGTMNLSGGKATLKLGSLIVGRSLFDSSEAGSATGTLTMSSNTLNQLDISGSGTVVQIGVSSGNQTTGTLTIGNLGGTSAITSSNNSTAVLIGNRTTSSGDTVTGTLNLNGGTVTITTTGAAIAGGGYATSVLNLQGGVTLKAGASSSNWIHSLDTAEIKTGGASIDTHDFNLTVAQPFTGAGGLTKAGLGTLVLSTAQGYTGPTAVSGGTLVLNAASTATTGNLTIHGGACLGGNGATPAAVTLQNSGKLLAEITDWTGAAGSGFTDLQVGALVIQDTWVMEITSPNTYANFTDAARSFPILTATGGISGFDPAKVTVQALGGFLGRGVWSVQKSGNTLVLVYDIQDTPVDDYAAWRQAYQNVDLSAPNDDHDGDGLSNFHEYAFGQDPTDPGSSNPVSGISELKSLGTFTYTRRWGSGLGYTVWKSTDLRIWAPANVQETAGDYDANGVETVTVRVLDPMPDGGFFLRVKAE